jgi:hypothetical protein
MRKIQLITGLFCLTSILSTGTRAQEWKGVKMLRSTRYDVEELIGNPMKPDGNVYDLKEERVTITYSRGHCAKSWPFGWNVPEDTVIGISVYLKGMPMPGDLGIDLSKFKKLDDPHVGGITYHSPPSGEVTIQTDSDGRIVMLSYSPATNNNQLLCAEAAARELEIKRGEAVSQKPLLNYLVSRTPSTDEKGLLKYFAEQLSKSPAGSKGYIIAYAGRRARVNEAQGLANRAKAYLVKKLGFEAQNILAIAGGHQEEAQVDLYIVEPGRPKPLTSPTVHPMYVQTIGLKATHMNWKPNTHDNQKP